MSIIIQEVSKNYKMRDGITNKVLNKVTLEIKTGSFVCIVGPSGCGKSTLLNIIAGLQPMDAGKIIFNEPNNTQKIGYVFQTPRLLPWRTVIDNLTVVMRNDRKLNTKDRAQAESALLEVNLLESQNRYIWELSEGMKTRVNIARALAIQPTLLLMDEPFAHLDHFSAQYLREELLVILGKKNITTIFVTHNVREACWFADEVFLFSERPVKIINHITIPLQKPRDYFGIDILNLEQQIILELRENHATNVVSW